MAYLRFGSASDPVAAYRASFYRARIGQEHLIVAGDGIV